MTKTVRLVVINTVSLTALLVVLLSGTSTVQVVALGCAVAAGAAAWCEARAERKPAAAKGESQ